MKILFLAPHPFYQDRGSPIAGDMILRVLSKRGNQVDVVTYAEGRDIKYDYITIHRIPSIPFVGNIRPGFSWKKIICDCFMFFKVIRLVSRKRYHFVHAVEESVFIALVVKALFKIPYVYDMDSSLVEQLIEKYYFLMPFADFLKFFERIAVTNAKAVMPVCDALAAYIEKYNPKKVVVLSDVSLLK
jgi:glycosyltransferase involved in cell wall biosynthesis